MGVFFDNDIPRDWIALEGKAQTTDEKYMDATVSVGEINQGRWRGRNGDYSLVARATQLILTYATMNATAGSSVRMRLMAPAGSSYAKKFHRRAIGCSKKNRYLRNPMKGYGPGTKAADWADKAGDLVEIVDHPALDIMRNPNPLMRGTTWMFHNLMQWQLTGRRYTHVVEGGGKPKELWPMLCQFTKIIPSREGLIGGYVYGRDGAIEDVFETDEVYYHRFRPSPFNPYDAIGPMHSVVQESDIYSAATVSELATWENQGRPDWVLPVDPETTEDQMKQLRAAIDKMYKGPRNRGKMLIATLGSEPKALQFTPKEMEYLLGKADIRSVIRTAYGIPESMDEGNEANLTSAGAGEVQHGRYTILPLVNQDAEEWSETLLYQGYGIDPNEARFVYDDPVPENREQLRQDIQVFVPAGIWSPNEARAKLGDDPREGGDEYTPGPREMADITAKHAAEAAKNDPKNGDKADKGGKALEPDTHTCDCNNTGKHVAGKDRVTGIPATLSQTVASSSEPPERAVEALYDAVRSWLEMVAKLVGIPETATEFKLADLNEYLPKLIESINPPTQVIMRAGAEAGAVEAEAIGGTSAVSAVHAFTEDAANAAMANNLRLAGSVSQTTTDAIKRAIADGLERGDSRAQLSAAVREQLIGEAPFRATLISRTEAQRAMNYGKLEAWKRQGVWGSRIKLAPGACAICVEFVKAFGYERAIGEPYADLGASFSVPGRDKPVTLDYEAVHAPPIHPQCRCYIEPVFRNPEESK